MGSRYQVIELADYGDERGGLNVIEGESQVPFKIRRLFYNYSSWPNIERGVHANRDSSFAFVCVAGSCVVDVDDGVSKDSYVLDSPNKMLVIDKMVWKVMRSFSEDSVLLIVSDNVYDKSEYIYDYDSFLQEVRSGNPRSKAKIDWLSRD